ncbi:MAG TPA: hypothetical protein VMM93_08465, partial [Vicinamibacterales bacterium]|nr:hypothetical protein [Vicinamibacterales bacterium]
MAQQSKRPSGRQPADPAVPDQSPEIAAGGPEPAAGAPPADGGEAAPPRAKGPSLNITDLK